MAHRFVFVMDPLAGIDVAGDSTFAMMLESQARGHQLLFAEPRDLEMDGARPRARVRPVTLRDDPDDPFEVGAPERLDLEDAAAVFMRKDPPIDYDYVVATYVLDAVDRDKVVLINDPQALRDCNEKLYALRWSHLMPPTIVSAHVERIREFVSEVGHAVVKPLNAAGGSGVMLAQAGDKNLRAIVDLLTSGGRRPLMAQAYLEAVTEGDRRVLLVGGKPIGVINRRPGADDLRSNMHVGGTAEPAQLTDRDREICADLEPDLVSRGLAFVGIDVIGGHLTEINVTSPTGFQELNRFDGVNAQATLIDWVEARL